MASPNNRNTSQKTKRTLDYVEMECTYATIRNSRHTARKSHHSNRTPKEWPWKNEIGKLLETPKNAHINIEYKNLLQRDQYSCRYRVLAMAKHTIEYTDDSNKRDIKLPTMAETIESCSDRVITYMFNVAEGNMDHHKTRPKHKVRTESMTGEIIETEGIRFMVQNIQRGG